MVRTSTDRPPAKRVKLSPALRKATPDQAPAIAALSLGALGAGAVLLAGLMHRGSVHQLDEAGTDKAAEDQTPETSQKNLGSVVNSRNATAHHFVDAHGLDFHGMYISQQNDRRDIGPASRAVSCGSHTVNNIMDAILQQVHPDEVRRSLMHSNVLTAADHMEHVRALEKAATAAGPEAPVQNQLTAKQLRDRAREHILNNTALLERDPHLPNRITIEAAHLIAPVAVKEVAQLPHIYLRDESGECFGLPTPLGTFLSDAHVFGFLQNNHWLTFRRAPSRDWVLLNSLGQGTGCHERIGPASFSAAEALNEYLIKHPPKSEHSRHMELVAVRPRPLLAR